MYFQGNFNCKRWKSWRGHKYQHSRLCHWHFQIFKKLCNLCCFLWQRARLRIHDVSLQATMFNSNLNATQNYAQTCVQRPSSRPYHHLISYVQNDFSNVNENWQMPKSCTFKLPSFNDLVINKYFNENFGNTLRSGCCRQVNFLNKFILIGCWP
jgi:hypothetical protein